MISLVAYLQIREHLALHAATPHACVDIDESPLTCLEGDCLWTLQAKDYLVKCMH